MSEPSFLESYLMLSCGAIGLWKGRIIASNDYLSYSISECKAGGKKTDQNPLLCSQDARATKEENEREKTEDLKEMMLQEIRRRPIKNEKEIMEKERMRRMELYQQQMIDRRGSATDALLEVQEQLLKIFSKLKVSLKVDKAFIFRSWSSL